MKATPTTPQLTPLLVVRDAARAIAFYIDALGAREVARYLDKSRSKVSHADLTLPSELARVGRASSPPLHRRPWDGLPFYERLLVELALGLLCGA